MAPCPYCETNLDPKPKRGKKCPHCGNQFYARNGELMTWGGAQEHDKAKRRGYETEVHFCPNCGDLKEGHISLFNTITPCWGCRRYIDWHHNTVVRWKRVSPDKDWFDPRLPRPGRPGIDYHSGVMGIIELKDLNETDNEQDS